MWQSIKKERLLREIVPQLLNDPFESIEYQSEDTQVRFHNE